MGERLPKAGFTDMDREADPSYYVGCLDRQRAGAFNRAYKWRTFELLDIHPGDRVLDIGCGTGDDALEMAELVGADGKVVGIDHSQTMVEEARDRSRASSLPIEFLHGDAHHLPLPDGGFDRCRADKTFQHLSEPERALCEVIRVTEPGGCLHDGRTPAYEGIEDGHAP